MMKILDYRSDTASPLTPEMFGAIEAAVVGDDVLGEDPTVRRLEEMSAELFGKEAGLFVASGTMANQIAIMALTVPGDEVVVGEQSHIYGLECGGLAALSGVQARPLGAVEGRFAPADVESAIRPAGLQFSRTRVLCLENTFDLNRGIPLPPDYQDEMADIARRHGVTVYLDGARIFNAAVAFDTELRQFGRSADCLQFCLTKALSAPIGSVLLGSAGFIERARMIRQRIGGGMRQVGYMAAAGVVALEKMLPRIQIDHDNARRLRDGLARIDERLVELNAPSTNIVRMNVAAAGREVDRVIQALSERGVRIKKVDERTCRMVTHSGIESADIDAALVALNEVL